MAKNRTLAKSEELQPIFLATTSKITIGIDLGDRFSHRCLLGPDGVIVAEGRVRSTPEGMGSHFKSLPRSRVAIEVGAYSRARAATDQRHHDRSSQQRRCSRRNLHQRSQRRHQDALAGCAGGGTYCDMEIRYALGRGDRGIYVYAIFTHPPSYRAGGVGAESRYITRLSQSFDWITVDKDRNMLEAAPTERGTGVVVHAKEQRIMSKGVYKNSVEHKYSYSGVQYKTPAYGWSSTKNLWYGPRQKWRPGGTTAEF